MAAYYNEIDPFAAQWLRNLIAAGHIAPGDVDERSIEDVSPDDLRGYTQCHFFAGIGVWSLALRRAGWDDDRAVWTGSCPCQPFSAAGKGAGFADERHLWPAFHYLISQCGPPVVFGEQVASKDGLGWLDLVRSDLEGSGYTAGAADLCAAGVGAPHIRQRLWWVGVADTNSDGLNKDGHGFAATGGYGDVGNRASRRMADAVPAGRAEGWTLSGCGQASGGGSSVGVGDGQRTGLEGYRRHGDDRNQPGRIRAHPDGSASPAGAVDRVAQPHGWQRDGLTDSEGCDSHGAQAGRQQGNRGAKPCGTVDRVAHTNQQQRVRGLDAGAGRGIEPSVCGASDGPGPVNGHWGDADWLFCRDGKWRPVEPGTFPLVDGAPSRVGRLRAYGNAIVPQVAEAFVRACDEWISQREADQLLRRRVHLMIEEFT